ncbi:glycosyltransferase [Microbacterium sp. UFMG61]|uniref:glycosyltransferase n=1 Tax=Microbacterium sp. UFMG61 TaxID=2745935 RepID=UPI00188E3273|nr:glycosyltransferase [Microbacterium sp. UFMG61]
MTVPLVSIVLPVFNDVTTIALALESALTQTLSDVEIVCVDDASTDGTDAVIEAFAGRDDRVRLLRHAKNSSAFQARRTGVLAARADYLLFLDGDDELVSTAAELGLALARSASADLIGFGVSVVEADGRTGNAYERRLQPVHDQLRGNAVLRGLFPIGEPAQGQLWRYLFRTSILRTAYAALPVDLSLPRINDLPLMFLVAALAESYASTNAKLYRYHFGRGGSGHQVDSVERAEFYASAIRSIDSIRSAVDIIANSHADGELLRASYESARLSIIGYVCFQLVERSDPDVLSAALIHLVSLAPAEDIIRGAARFYPVTLKTLKYHMPRPSLAGRQVRNVLLATSTLRTGGVSAVLASQARYLSEAGYHVIVVARSAGSEADAVPAGVDLIQLTSRDLPGRLAEWGLICREHDIDVVIDHQMLYTQYWPEYALAARAEGALTIGWLHNFVARPILDGTDRLALIEACSNTLAHITVLSPLDVAYFRLRGIDHVSYAPNPPSSLLLDSVAKVPEKHAPREKLRLVWWGRLEQQTKQVYELIELGVQLRAQGASFTITVIGPDWDDVTARSFNVRARQHGVADAVVAIGPRRGNALVSEIDSADAFVTTSLIEGYQLTIAEAQSRGLPVFMYELPWLTLVKDNEGVVSVPQGDAAGLARQIILSLGSAEIYRNHSRASLERAMLVVDHDYRRLYEDLLNGTPSAEFRPHPTMDDARTLLRLFAFYAARSHHRNRTRNSTTSLGAKIWRWVAPAGKRVIRRLPALRPLAHRAKGWLRAR